MQRFKKEGNLIKKNRMESGLTQGHVAKHLGYTSPQFISNIERGIAGVPPQDARALCEYLSIPYKKWVDVRVKSYRDFLMSGS